MDVGLCLCVDSQKLQLLTTSEIRTPITLRSVVTEKHGLKMEIPDSQWLEESSRQGEGRFMDLKRIVSIPAYNYLYLHTLSLFFIGELQGGNLTPNVPISCLPPSRVDPKVQGLKVIIDCPQPGSSRAT